MSKDEVEKTSEEKLMDEKDYNSFDVGLVLKQVNFHFWGEVVDWLKKHGTKETGLERDKVNKMIRDFQELSGEGVAFTNNPEEAERLAKESR